MPANRRIHEVANGVVSLPGALLLPGVRGLFDEVSEQADVALLPQQNAIGRQTIASGATRLLVILFDRLRQREMNHGPDSGLIDAQAEGDGANEHAHLILHPAFLVDATCRSVHLSMVGQRGYSLSFEEGDRLSDTQDRG